MATQGPRAQTGTTRPPLALLIAHDVALSLARLWWFVAWSDGELGAGYLAAANVAGVLEAMPRWRDAVAGAARNGRSAVSGRAASPTEIVSFADGAYVAPPVIRLGLSLSTAATRSVALGWAMASWTRASLTLQNRLPVTTLRDSTADDSRAVACAELLGAWLLLRVAGRLLGARFAPKPWHAPALLLLLLAIDEFAHHVLVRALLGPPPRPFTVCGRPVPGDRDAKDEDCCICLGSSLFDDEEEEEQTKGKSKSGSNQPILTFDPAPQHAGRVSRSLWDLGSDNDLDDSDSGSEGSTDDGSETDSLASSEFHDARSLPGSYPLSSSSQPLEPIASSSSAPTAVDAQPPTPSEGLPRSSSAAMLAALAVFPDQPPTPTPQQDILKDPLECFCRHPQHIAHRRCMARWLSSSNVYNRRRRPRGRCPMCRQPLLVHLKMLPGNQPQWQWDWNAMWARGLVSAGCVGGVIGAVYIRGWFKGWWTSSSKKVAVKM